ncbi:LRR receptor-like serine/threonine-protein kinase FLS2 [Gossypium australe]|uniref:LRR receptor-like serine/threonine-protein kinase FLS2 n=1 Tax=Gossypium australe TaxID=47621 RepID=A0A5B6WEQ4_9ROSI|nr:LRR receptor-like serine/threonine-protein kinase FLS2 [Gossypium australe]
MTSLTHLDLSSNYLNSSIPDWLYSFSSLQVLRLPSNQLHGDISSAIGNLTSLNELDLSRNELQGKLPRTMGKLCKLRSINLSGMRLNQDISRILEILSGCSSSRLESWTWLVVNFLVNCPIKVYIFNNLLEGVVSEKHFANHTKLKYFYGSGNSLVLRANPNWVPPFQILDLDLGSWQIGPSFPLWLRSQKHLEYLDISNSRISDVIPRWFWGLSTQFRDINLSRNQISGQIPYLPKGPNIFTFFDLSFNNFSGPLPQISMGSNQYMIDLSNNYFSGSLFHFLCYQLNGTITTGFLGIANNLLSGEIPDCWIKWQSLQVLRLDGNRFTGKIPSSMGTLSELQSLNLHNNKLHGEIPLSLKNCTNLVAINLGKNELDGNIPRWLGQDLTNLIILILRSNKFGGNIPDHLCALSSLQILDLAENNLFGSMPRCMSNFSAMVRGNGSRDNIIEYRGLNGPSTLESASIATKDQLLVYDKTLNLVRLVDFSCNNLSGEIPKEVTSLQGLQTLNLSRNHLTGKIPESIGSMKSLESLDLSQNQLSSSIPESMSSMTFLSHLNLSFNNLTGIIPKSSQLQGFNESCYAGNHLCGSPLKGCRGSGKEPDVRNEAKEISKGQEINWFYISIPLGFVTGFWCVLGPLMISKRWRILYFRFLGAMWWKVVKMKTYLQAYDLWEVVNTDIKLAPLKDNATVAQIKHYSDKQAKRYKTMSCIQNDVSDGHKKVIPTLSKRYESKISSLEDSRDLSDISLPELIYALYAKEQRRASKREEHEEEALQALSIEGEPPET